jgi:hypothetical protein
MNDDGCHYICKPSDEKYCSHVLNTMHGGAMQAERSMNVDANWIQ